MTDQQNYQNHTRWHPLVHFVITPLLLINFVWALVCVVMEFDWFRAQYLLLSFTVILLSIAARLQSLKAQARVIRLEEKLRYREVLSTELAGRFHELRTGQIIALRFASDEELAGLVERTLNREFADTRSIKQAITNWRGDYLRV
jgi:hypothetical protein